MKGISSVIAVVLLLMITIALVGMAWVFFQNLWGTVSTNAGNAATNTGETLATSFSLGSAKMQTNATTGQTCYNKFCENLLYLYVTNTGTITITKEKFSVYIDGNLAREEYGQTGNLAPGTTATLKMSNITGRGDAATKMICTSAVKVMYGSAEQDITITC